jgi:hypothetical protein
MTESVKTFLSSDRARTMAEISQSPLQMRGISSKGLLKALPWVDVTAGVYQVNRSTDAEVQVAARHAEGGTIPKTFVGQELSPRQYDLSVVQTILQLHSRAVDLYNKPFEQTGEQVRLIIESLREKQEYEMINNPEFGLLHSAVPSQRISARGGVSTLDDMDELISLRRDTQFLFAHPRAIAALGEESNHLGLGIQTVPLGDKLVPAWRGIPILSCNKIPVSENNITSVIAMRTGENNSIVFLKLLC